MKYQIARWLNGLEGVHDVEPIQFCIEGILLEGAGYTQHDKYYYYIVGDLPEPHIAGREICFRLRGNCDWWVCDHWKDITALNLHMQSHHPFGPNWTITPWLGLAWLGSVSMEDFMGGHYERSYISLEIYTTEERIKHHARLGYLTLSYG